MNTCKMTWAICILVLACGASALAQQRDQGPPPFISYPILIHVPEGALDHGHFVASEEVGIPSAIAPNLGTASFAPAKPGGGLSAGSDRDASNALDSYQGETSAASNGTVLVGTSNSIYPGSCSTKSCGVRAYTSADGVSWLSNEISRTWNGTTFGITFDPAVDYDKNGNFYFSFGGAPLSSNYPNSIAVSKSGPDGTSWSTPVAVTFNTRQYFDDKYYLAVDRSNSAYANRVYVSWDRNQQNNQILYISYSSNGGATWSAPVKVNDGTKKTERVIGAYPAVDQNTGVVYDSWHDYAKNIIFVDKSLTGGATWGTDVAAANTHAGFGQDIGCVGGRSQGPAHALKVGPSGTLYLVYADPVASRGFDVLFTRSTDGGKTWSSPVSLNDDTTANDQFHPTLSVSSGTNGDVVTVSFYDRRDDTANCSAHVYATQSKDGGATWAANVRVTSEASDFDGNPNGPGDYSSSSPHAGSVWPFFSDHRQSNINIETGTAGGFEVYTAPIQ